MQITFSHAAEICLLSLKIIGDFLVSSEQRIYDINTAGSPEQFHPFVYPLRMLVYGISPEWYTDTYAHTFADLFIGLDKQNFERKSGNIVLPISFNICFGCYKEPSH